jgi:hypothetical protein
MKIFKFTKLPLLLWVTIAVPFASCSDWLDINSNPYVANDQTNIDPGYLFNYAATTHSSNRQGGDFYIPLLISGQTVADGGFVDLGGYWSESLYDISIYSTGNTWVTAYANVGTNLIKAKEFALKNENINAIVQAEILQAQALFEMTMIFGDVPFSEALNIEEYKTPKFDTQKDVLDGLLVLLDDALAKVDLDSPGIQQYDIFYGGDMTKWAKLARSLKLKILMIMVDKDQSKEAAIKLLVEDDAIGFINEESEWIFPFFEEASTQNPNFRINDRYAAPGEYYMFFAHNSVLDLMKPLNDPRLPVYFEKGVDGNYNGLLTSEDVEDVEGVYLTSPINFQRVWAANAPDVMYSFSELSFHLAEVYARGLGVTQDLSKAQEHYLAGVESALGFWQIESAEVDAFIAQLGDISTMNQEDALEAIYSQVWVDLMLRPFEAWVHSRRTSFPELTVPELAPYESLIYRWVYPDRERNVNPNVPSPLPEITDKMWFQK